MDRAKLIRRVRFRASHRYGRPGATAEEDRARFGDQADPHEHDWTVEIHVAGELDPRTGWVTDLAALDASIDRLMGAWDGGDLNALVPPVAAGEMQPSTEALARWLFGELRSAVAPPARLAQVRVFESPDLGAAYPA